MLASPVCFISCPPATSGGEVAFGFGTQRYHVDFFFFPCGGISYVKPSRRRGYIFKTAGFCCFPRHHRRVTNPCTHVHEPRRSNPFVECGIASQAVYEATINHNMNHVALERLHQRIGDFTMEVGASTGRLMPKICPFSSRLKKKVMEIVLPYVQKVLDIIAADERGTILP